MDESMKMQQLPENFGEELKETMAEAAELQQLLEDEGNNLIMPVGINVRSPDARLLTGLTKSTNPEDTVRAMIKRVPNTDQLEITSAIALLPPSEEPVTLFYPSNHRYCLQLYPDATINIEYTIDMGVPVIIHEKFVQEVFLMIEKERPTVERAVDLISDMLCKEFISIWSVSIEHKLKGDNGVYEITMGSGVGRSK